MTKLENLKQKFQENYSTIEWLGYNLCRHLAEENVKVLKEIKKILISEGAITGRDDDYALVLIENEIVYNIAKNN
jgi:hypothetical protein